MKDILPFYEREHGNLALLTAEFAEQYPQLAASLGFVNGQCDDPSVQRIIEAMTMLGARILQQLEDSYPQFTEALLGLNHPQLTEPFPSASIACFDVGEAAARSAQATATVPRGTMMNAIQQQGTICQFQTVYPVTIAPLALPTVRFTPCFDAPAGTTAPAGVTGVIHIGIACGAGALAVLAPRALRVFIDAAPSLRASVRDALFMRTLRAFAEGADGRWIALASTPIAAVGFADDEAMIAADGAAHPAYRLLTDYFAFPEKFNFFDIDLGALLEHAAPGAERITLHLALDSGDADGDMARILQTLAPQHLRLFCTPVLNLFQRPACPIDLTHTQSEYGLLASAEQPAAYDIHSIRSVHVVRDTPKGSAVTEFHPYYSMRHGLAEGRKGHYWCLRRDNILAQTSPGHEARLSLVDIDLNPLALETATISVELNCTNRDLACALPVGAQAGDLKLARGAGQWPIRLLRKPTPPYRYPAGAHWRLIAHLSLNHRSLVEQDRAAFAEMLALYDLPQTNATQRQIRGVMGLAHASARAWLHDRHGGARLHGVEVRLTLDEAAFVGGGLHVFAQVIEHFLGLYAHLNTFTRLVVVSHATGKELIRCPARSGTIALV